MKFTKYHKYGAYHWKWYKNPIKYKNYKKHVDKINAWIKEDKILDIGCGDGLITYILGGKGIDNEKMAIKVGKRRGANIEFGDAYSLPFQDEEFDAVFMGDLLEHLEFPQKAIKEARRVLKKYLYLVVPIHEFSSLVYNHTWTEEKLKNLVEKQGFVQEEEQERTKTTFPKIYAKFKKI